ncbi:MAG TPA: hypothetical protein VGD05_06270 [Pyrinomonadaceae bacterium]|jgi:hypothetical protein
MIIPTEPNPTISHYEKDLAERAGLIENKYLKGYADGFAAGIREQESRAFLDNLTRLQAEQHQRSDGGMVTENCGCRTNRNDKFTESFCAKHQAELEEFENYCRQ